MGPTLFWLLLTLFFIFMEAFFSMMEMALVSFNKVRLQYYLNKGNHRASWIQSLLRNPSRLFGTILLGVNIALEFGSECSRLFYSSLGLNPDIAPLTQVLLVIIFAELAPLFAARRYAESVAMLGIPLIYALSILMTPLVWLFGLFARLVNHFLGNTGQTSDLYLSRDELQRVLEEQDEGLQQVGEKEDFNLVVANIFNLRSQVAKQVMAPLKGVKMIPAQCTVGEMSAFLRKIPYSHLPLYHRFRHQIVGLVSPRDLIRAPDKSRVREFAAPPWFITENMPLVNIIKQFRVNRQDVAVVLNGKGEATGILTLDDILDAIFGKLGLHLPQQASEVQLKPIVERTLPGEMLLSDFNAQFQANLQGVETLEELADLHLGEQREQGASFRIDRFEFTVTEMTLLGTIKSLSVRTLS